MQGYPQPTITWKLGGQNATTSNKPHKYEIEQTVSTGPPFVVESNLTIKTLWSEDSGNVTCVAVVTTNEEKPLINQRTFYLSFVGEFVLSLKPRLHKPLNQVGIRVKLIWVGVDTPNLDSNPGYPTHIWRWDDSG